MHKGRKKQMEQTKFRAIALKKTAKMPISNILQYASNTTVESGKICLISFFNGIPQENLTIRTLFCVC